MTEVGVIPEDWKDASLGELAEIRMCKRIFSEQTNPTGDIPFFKIGTFGRAPDAFISGNLYREYKRKYSFPKKGDVLLSAAGTLGKTVIYDGEDAYFQDSNIVWLDIDRTKIKNEYLYQCYQAIKWASPEGSTISRLYNGIIRKTKIPLPPTETEQRAIAQALSDVDALLAALDKIIAKKRDLKQATMQQLLTGETRLPGFSGNWDVVEFGDIATIRNEKILCSSTPEGTPCVELEFIGQANGRLLGYIEATGASSKYSFKEGDVLFGRLRAYLRKHWRATFDGVCSTEIWPLIPRNERLYKGYLHLLVQMNSFVDAACVSYGTHMPRSDWAVLGKFEVQLPSMPEQVAISASLSDMDAELEALENSLEKTRQLKQAMMQELLTGKTRLV